METLKLKYINLLLIAVLGSFPFYLQAQINLVPNGSFESYSNCPDNYSQITYADGWRGYGFVGGAPTTPEYYNACGTPSFQTPQNIRGFQPAFDGKAYASINAYNDALLPDNKNEFLGIKLTQPLTIGTKYNVSFMVCLTEESKFGIKDMGLKFFTIDPEALPQILSGVTVPEVISTTVLKDTKNWMQVVGTYTPTTPGIQYIAIGNFNLLQLTTKTVVNGFKNGSHYYVDDVRVTTDSIPVKIPVKSFIKKTPVYNICVNDCVTFQDSATGNPDTYIWKFDGAMNPSVSAKTPGNVCYNKVGTYSVQLIVGKGQDADTFTYANIVNVNKAPSTNIGPDTIIKKNQVFNLNARTSDSSINNTYKWNTGQNSPFITVNQPGTYSVTVSNSCGAFTDSIVLKRQSSEVNVVNAFSPNGDGFNDVYELKIADLPPNNFSLQVQDRWGKVIQDFTKPDFTWDGKDKQGIQCAPGLYIGKLHFETDDPDTPKVVDEILRIYITL